MNNAAAVYRAIEKKHPKLVFLSGKTSTGKTTLSRELQKRYNCAGIELDAIVEKLESPKGTNKYIEAYQKRDHIDFTRSFVAATQQEIRKSLNNHDTAILDGAVANPETLREIISDWSDSFLFIYFDIKNIDVYTKRLTNRFELTTEDNGNGLPSLFWEKFDPEVLKEFYISRQITPRVKSAIKDYAVDSMDASKARLAKYSSEFDHILRVEV